MPSRASQGFLVSVAVAACVVLTSPALAQERPYVPKNGVLNWKALLLGGGFRVTTVVPLHGDFSRFGRIAVVRSESLIGADVPAVVLARITASLADEFSKGGRFTHVTVVDVPERQTAAPGTIGFGLTVRDADALDAPLRTRAELDSIDRERAALERAESDDTLLIRSEVIDYAKGNKWLQLLMLDLGNAIITVRFTYIDQATGEELGRSVISSDSSSKVIPSALSTRTALSGLSEGLADQVTRRKMAGER